MAFIKFNTYTYLANASNIFICYTIYKYVIHVDQICVPERLELRRPTNLSRPLLVYLKFNKLILISLC